MPLLKYTTKIEADKTASQIQKMLAENGAKKVLFEYGDEGFVEHMNFIIDSPKGDLPIRLPCDWRPVLEVLEQDGKVPQRLATKEQAIRVAWRIVMAWVEAQMAILKTKMVVMPQIFLPYVVDIGSDKTLYEKMIDTNFQIEAPKVS